MIYHVFANRMNIGDWLAARGIESQLTPRPVQQLLIDDYYVNETVVKLQKATENDLIVIGGGGLLMDYFLPFWSAFEVVSRSVPFVLWGVGYCDFKSQSARPPHRLIEALVGRSRLCVFRDELTRSDFASFHLPPATLCPSLLMLGRTRSKTKSLIHGVHYGVTGEDRYQRMCDMVRRFATDSGHSYIELNNEIKPNSEQSLAQQIDYYRSAELVISTRLHGCIIGLACGAKALGVSGDHKVEAFMESVGLADWVCPIDDLAQLPHFMGRLERQPSVESALEEARRANREIGRQVAAIADEIHSVAGSTQ